MILTRKITLQQADNDDGLYIVESLVNCVEPTAGSVLTTKQVERLMGGRYTTVTIKRAKS